MQYFVYYTTKWQIINPFYRDNLKNYYKHYILIEKKKQKC